MLKMTDSVLLFLDVITPVPYGIPLGIGTGLPYRKTLFLSRQISVSNSWDAILIPQKSPISQKRIYADWGTPHSATPSLPYPDYLGGSIRLCRLEYQALSAESSGSVG